MANVVLNSSAIVGKKEQLSDVIYALDPFETPIVNSIGKGSCSRITYDWQVDDFNNGDGDTTNGKGTVVGEGHEFETQYGSFTDRMRTVNQINERGFGITATAEVEQKAGRSSELAYQMAKVAKKFKMDMEMQLAGGHRAKVFTETAGYPRCTGGISNWLTKNVVQVESGYPSSGTNTTNASGYFTGTPASKTAVTSQNLNKAGQTGFGANTGICQGEGFWLEMTNAATKGIQEHHLQDLLTDLYMESGKSPNILVVDPKTKTQISNTFVGRGVHPSGAGVVVPTVNSNMTDKTVQSIVDVYVSDFGTLRIVPSRFIGGDLQNSGMAFALDTSMWSIDYLRPFSTYDLPKTGDYVRKAMNAEWALRCNNPNSSAMIIDFAKGNPIKSVPVNPDMAIHTVKADPSAAVGTTPAKSHSKPNEAATAVARATKATK